MILNLDDFKKITCGAEDIVLADKGYDFFRFNKKEQELYTMSPIESRTHTPAGIQLRFKTDATKICIKGLAENCCDRSFFAIDVFEDGKLAGCINNFEEEKMTGFYSWSKYPLGNFDGSISLGDGIKEVRVVMPFSVHTYIKEISLENATVLEEIKRNKKVFFYGDSITHGYDTVHPSNAYSVRLSEFLDAECVIKAVGGEVFRPELAQIKHDATPEYVFVAYGTNDWSQRNKDAFDRNSSKFIENIKENFATSKIFVLTPIWRKDNVPPKPQGNDFDDILYVGRHLREICNNMENVVCIDGWNLVPHDENLYGDLRLHPNDKGFDFYARNLFDEIKKHI